MMILTGIETITSRCDMRQDTEPDRIHDKHHGIMRNKLRSK